MKRLFGALAAVLVVGVVRAACPFICLFAPEFARAREDVEG